MNVWPHKYGVGRQVRLLSQVCDNQSVWLQQQVSGEGGHAGTRGGRGGQCARSVRLHRLTNRQEGS